MLKPGDQVAQTHFTTIPRVTVQCDHVTLMNVLNRSSSPALDLQYDNTMETRCSERGLLASFPGLSPLFLHIMSNQN